MDRILIVEDNNDNFHLLSLLLNNIGFDSAKIFRYERIKDVLALKKTDFDIVLTNLCLPDSECPATFRHVYSQFPYTPIIVLAETSEIDVAVHTIKQGAQDYLIKGEFDGKTLSKAIQYAVERKKAINDYTRLFEDNPAPMYIYDNDTFRFLAINNAGLHRYGYSKEEFLALTAFDIRPIEDVQPFLDSSGNVPNQYCDYGRWRHITKSGNLFYVHIYAHSTEFEGKAATIVIAIDINARIEAEKALQEKNSEIENILESITDGFYTVNENWEITYFNKEAERILEQRRDDVIGKNIWDHFPRSREGKFYPEYQRAMQEKISVYFEEYYAPKGIWGAMSVYPTKDGLAVFFVDITKQKQIQEQIFNDEQNLRAIINNTEDIIWSMDKNYDIISANQAFWDRIEKITGKHVNKIAPQHVDGYRLQAWEQYFEQAFNGNTFRIIWNDVLDGKEVFEEVSFNPIRDMENNVIGISCFSRDITQQRRHTQIIESQNKHLREIAWIQSHKVRGPVASILGLILLLDSEREKDPQNAEVVKLIGKGAEALDTVIKEIISHTDIDTGSLVTKSMMDN